MDLGKKKKKKEFGTSPCYGLKLFTFSMVDTAKVKSEITKNDVKVKNKKIKSSMI